MIEIQIKSNAARINRSGLITSGMVGARCEFVFDSAWDGLSKTAVFIAGSVQRDVLLTESECVIPWEVLEKPGYQLYIGVYGVNGNGDLVIPTIYANAGNILPGADPSGDESTDPSLPVWAQIQNEVGDLDDLETQDKSNLVAAINEAAQSGGGEGGTSDHRQLTNKDAVNQHPISSITGLQSALSGKANASDIPSLSGYATEEWVENKGYLTEHQSLAGYATETYVNNHHDDTKQDFVSDLNTIRSGAAKGATAVQPEAGKGLFSGSYNDLTNKPTIPTLDGYATETYVNNHHDNTKQDALTAGENISIIDNVISAAGGGGGFEKIVDITLESDVNVVELIPGDVVPGLYIVISNNVGTSQNSQEESAVLTLKCGAGTYCKAENVYSVRTRGNFRTINLILVGINSAYITAFNRTASERATTAQSEEDMNCSNLRFEPKTTGKFFGAGSRYVVNRLGGVV